MSGMFCWGAQWVQVKLEFVSMCVIFINLVVNHLHTFMHTMVLNGIVYFMILWQNSSCRIIHLTATYTMLTRFQPYWASIEHVWNLTNFLAATFNKGNKFFTWKLQYVEQFEEMEEVSWFYLSRNVNLKEYTWNTLKFI